MTRHFQITVSLIILVIITWSVSACNSTPKPPEVSAINADPGTNIMIGESASLTVKASGQDLQFNWSATRGKLSSETAPSVIYEAPDSPGPDTVTVNVVGSGGATTIQSITFQVTAPTPTPTPISTPSPTPTYTLMQMQPTDTPVSPTETLIPTEPSIPTEPPIPTDTSTPPPTPIPLECRHPALTSYIFPQLQDISNQRAFFGPLEESKEVFLCEGIRDIVRSAPAAVRVQYHIDQGTGKYGFFGVGTLGGYDATQFKRLCLWVYAQQPDQAFRLKLKDILGVEQGVNVTTNATNEWTQICVDLNKFLEQGVDLSQLDNVNLGFEEANGNAEIWVDDFEFTQ